MMEEGLARSVCAAKTLNNPGLKDVKRNHHNNNTSAAAFSAFVLPSRRAEEAPPEDSGGKKGARAREKVRNSFCFYLFTPFRGWNSGEKR
jgi:hypothetical protein